MIPGRYTTVLAAFCCILWAASSSLAANTCQQNPVPAKAPYNTISSAQYDQLELAITRNKGYKSQGWGDYHPCNVTPSCGTNSELKLLHPGVDLAAGINTPVYTPVSGQVINRVDGSDCSDGSCLSYVAIYNAQTNKTYLFLHMRLFNVNIGDTVTANVTKVGGVGKRGAGGYHVHYEVRDGRLNPARPAGCISSTLDPYANTPFNNPIPAPQPAPAGAPATSWSFNTNGDYEGWTATNASATSVVNGIFFIDPSGDDPYVSSPLIATNLLTDNASAILYPFVKVKMASNGLDNTGAIYFKTAYEDYYSPDKIVVFHVNNCSLCGTAPFQEYTVPMSPFFGGNFKWTGVITGIRLDPTGRGQGGTNKDSIGIDYIRLAGWGDLGGGASDDVGPFLSINSHNNGQTVTSNAITLFGTASDFNYGDNGISSVTVNGVRAQNDTTAGQGTANWSLTVNLLPGPNLITVVATDESDLYYSTARSITIYYQSPQPTPTPTPAVHSLQGRVLDEQNRPVGNVALTVTNSNGAWWQASTNSDGNYSVGSLPSGLNYTVTPSKTNYSFSPTGWSIGNLSTDLQQINFTARQSTFTIRGRVIDALGRPLDNVKLTLSGAISRITQSNVNGDYSFNGLPGGGNVGLAAQKPNYYFNNSYIFVGFGLDETADFTGTLATLPAVYSPGVYALPLRAPGSELEQKITRGGMARAVAALSGLNLSQLFARQDASGQWPTELGGVSVTIDGRSAKVLSLTRSPDQFNETYYVDFAVPEQTTIGSNIVVTAKHNSSGRSWSKSVPVQSSAPALWATNSTVAGDAVAQDADTFTTINWDNPVRADGSRRVVLYGTGLREAASRGELNVVGRNGYGLEYILPLEFGGPQQFLPGLDQITVRITPFMTGGSSISVWIIGSEESQVTIPILVQVSREGL